MELQTEIGKIGHQGTDLEHQKWPADILKCVIWNLSTELWAYGFGLIDASLQNKCPSTRLALWQPWPLRIFRMTLLGSFQQEQG